MRNRDDRAGDGDYDGDGKQVAGMLRHVMSLFLVLALAWMPQAVAQDAGDADELPAADVPETIRVGLYVSPPFVMKDSGGRYAGMAIELWESAAEDLGWNHEYVEQRTFGDLIDAVSAGELDVAVTNLTVTRERAERMDFTHPWYDAGLRVMVGDRPGSRGTLFAALRRSGHLETYAGLAALMLLATWLLTLFDRKYDEEFPRDWRAGLAESLYHVVSVATSGKAPARKNMFGAAGRVLAALWMLCGVALIAYVTSSVTSVMTTMSLARQINGVSDLAGKTVGVLAGSTAEDYAVAEGFDVRRFDGIDSAVAALRRNQVVALIGDAPVLEYFAHGNAGAGVSVVGNTFSPEKYAFGLHHAAGVSKPLTVQLLGMQEDGRAEQVRVRYLGNGD